MSTLITDKWISSPLKAVKSLDNHKYESIVIISQSLDNFKGSAPAIFNALSAHHKLDKSVESDVSFLAYENSRLIYSPVKLNNDYDDVRSFAEAAEKGILRSLSAGASSALLAIFPDKKYPKSSLVSILGAFEALYKPLQYREDVKDYSKITEIGVFIDGEDAQKVCEVAVKLESSRYVARDLGGGDPERMAPPKFAQYVEELFANTSVKLEIISDPKIFEKDYPLFAAVNRASINVERHRGRIIFLTYVGEGPIEKTIMPVGKGITYDTGGADIKAGGIMAGMSYDKCGAANVVGFFQSLVKFAPKGIKAIGGIAVCRNNVGEECYVSDEVITSRAGVRVRVGNTDAEGRMAMTDLLCRLKELALNEVDPHLFTIATLTGHCCLALGTYTAVMDNGPAKLSSISNKLQGAGDEIGDMIEISTIRREDYSFILTPNDKNADILQCNNKGSSSTPRGHQFPAAFMIRASKLDKHCSKSEKPLKYTHIDIAGSSAHMPATPTGAPILALANYFYPSLLK